MAMLAEPRRKQKFGCDPRNTFWSDDDSKFGQRMLERMGWSKGKGLGANESGRTEHIVAVFRQKNDARGVGCSKKHADNWLAHQEDFNSLLKSLNQGQEAATMSTNTQDTNATGVVSLEEKSKSSRSRVHYTKLTRGKDLSSRSTHDLDCILGKRKGYSSESNTPQSQSAANSEEENSTEAAAPVAVKLESGVSAVDGGISSELSHGIKTVTSSSSIQEYFSQKMAELKKRQAGVSDRPRDSDEGSQDTCTSSRHTNTVDNSLDDKLHKQKKKKKKLEKGSVADERKDEVIEAEDGGLTKLINSDVKSYSKKNKKKKKKRDKKDEVKSDDIEQDAVVAAASSLSASDENVKSSISDREPVTQESVTDGAKEPPKKKSKKHRSSSGSKTSDTKDESLSTLTSDAGASFSTSGDSTDGVSGVSKHKTKKKKKHKKADTEEIPNVVARQTGIPKTAKKKYVRFSLGGNDLFVPGVEESIANDTSTYLDKVNGGQASLAKKRKRDQVNDLTDKIAMFKKKTKAEPLSQDVDSFTSSKKPHSDCVEDVQNGATATSVDDGASTQKNNKQKIKKKGPVDDVSKSFQGSNLAHVKGYGNLAHFEW